MTWQTDTAARTPESISRWIGREYHGVKINGYVPGHSDNGRVTHAKFKCICLCGRPFLGNVSTVKEGQRISCGCGRAAKRYIGKNYNGIIVLEYFRGRKNSESRFKCRCPCGSIFIAVAAKIRTGHTKSCGCKKSSLMIASKGCDGRSSTAEYMIYKSMLNRCFNKNDKAYLKYGAKGITVSDDWQASFDNFLRDMGKKPFPKASLDRINPHGPYSKENCRWASPKEQRANQIGSWKNIVTAMKYGAYGVRITAINISVTL